MKFTLLCGIFLALSLVHDTDFGDLPYVVISVSVFFIACIFLIRFLSGKKILFYVNYCVKAAFPPDRVICQLIFGLWFFILLSWAVAALSGLLNGVDPKFVFRNFFGLLLYVLFPVIVIVAPSVKSLILVIYYASIVQMCFGYIKIYEFFLSPTVNMLVNSSLSELRIFYNAGFIVIFPVFLVGLANKLLPYSAPYYNGIIDRLSGSVLFTLLTFITLIVPAMSKGFILTTLIFFIFITFMSIVFMTEEKKCLKKSIVALLIIVTMALLPFFLPEDYMNVLFHSFSSQEQSNSVRSEQFSLLVDEFTFLGNGLGAPLKSGYSRDDSGYGFELTYLNIVHKLGVFSLFLFMSYLITLITAITRIMQKRNVFESLFVVGLMGYLVVGSGNPLLLSTSAVILHCIAMYILVNPFPPQI